ncbi:MAG: hypothetical protein J6U07_08275, partial [Fibrobacter sp.]|nr:hypothetical protein [Fibrobacter sp.]
ARKSGGPGATFGGGSLGILPKTFSKTLKISEKGQKRPEKGVKVLFLSQLYPTGFFLLNLFRINKETICVFLNDLQIIA